MESTAIDKMEKISITKPESDAKAIFNLFSFYSLFFFPLCFFLLKQNFQTFFIIICVFGIWWSPVSWGLCDANCSLIHVKWEHSYVFEYRNSFWEASNHRKGKSTSFISSFQYTRMSVEKVRKCQETFLKVLKLILTKH